MTATSGEDGLPIVDLRFESLRRLQEDLGPFLAQEGLFLQGETRFGPSDVVRFRIMLPGDFVLVEGAGVIVWVRDESEAGPRDPAGAAMGFATLSEQGRELVEQMVQTHRDGGGRPFDLTRTAAVEEVDEKGAAGQTAGTGLKGLRLTVRGEPEHATERAAEAGKAVADAVAEAPQPEPTELTPTLPFADDSIEQPVLEVDEVEDVLTEEDEIVQTEVAEEAVEEMSLAEFGESILEAAVEEVGTDSDDAASSADLELESPADDGRDDWQRLEEILEPPETAPGSVQESSDPEEDVTVLEPVLEAAEAYAGRDTVSPPGAAGGERDPGPAFGGDAEDLAGGFLEDSLAASIEDADARRRTRNRSWLAGLAVIAVLVAAWLGWSSMSGRWPFSGATVPTDVVDAQERETPADLANEISDADLEAVVSAAVDAVVQEDEEPQPVGDDGPADDGAPADEGRAAEVVAVSEPATVIEELRWEPRSEGTVIVIRANGRLEESRIRAESLSSPPRVLIRLKGIQEAYRPLETAIDTADIRVMRVGHHPEKSPPSLWVVLDATGPGITVKGVDVEDDTARVLVGY